MRANFLPADMSESDRERLELQVARLRDQFGGAGYVGLFLEDSGRAFLAMGAEGRVAGWLLAPAKDEETAFRVATTLANLMTEHAEAASEESLQSARAALRRIMH